MENGVNMKLEYQTKLWKLINKYAESCGGNPAENIFFNSLRQELVIEIESLIGDIEFEATRLFRREPDGW